MPKTFDLVELEWTAAVMSARSGHPERLLKLLKTKVPADAYAYLSATIRASKKNSHGQRSRIDWQDAIDIRLVLRHYDRMTQSPDSRVHKAYGTKRELVAAMAKRFHCSVGTIRDIEARRGSYAKRMPYERAEKGR